MSVDELYREAILDHYRRPRNRGEMERPDRRVAVRNPLCGDDIAVDLRLDGDRVLECRFHGQGCSISQASASMMTGRVEGRRVAEALALAGAVRALLCGDAPAVPDGRPPLAPSATLGDLAVLAGVRRFPARIECALLAWNALESALREGAPGAANA